MKTKTLLIIIAILITFLVTESASTAAATSNLRPVRGREGVISRLVIVVIRQAKERCVDLGDCMYCSSYLATQLFGLGREVRVCLDEAGHYWVEDVSDDGYVFDMHPEGRQKFFDRLVELGEDQSPIENTFIFPKKSYTAKEFYIGEPVDRLTKYARRQSITSTVALRSP